MGDPGSSLKKTGSGATGTANSGMIRRLRVCGRTGTKRRRSKVSPSEGNEVRREGCQEVAVPHSSVEAGERPFRTPWSEGGAALWTGSWNHAEDTVPHQRVTAKRPGRVRDSDVPQRDEPGASTCTPGSVGAPGSDPWGDPAPGRVRLTETNIAIAGEWCKCHLSALAKGIVRSYSGFGLRRLLTILICIEDRS